MSYRDVWMGYDPARPVLKGISFEVTTGMKVAFVGATGSGKSTTANLLPRLYPYQRGEILIDGVPLPQLSRGPLRRAIGYVSQDVVVYAGTVRDNLLAAVDDAFADVATADAALWAASRRTGFADVLDGLADGLDHKLVDGGENLSMGERQLLAFTRMLLRDPRLLILDEATAHVDEACERLIQEATFQVMAGRTCFVVAHRLSTIVHCDLILVFQRGEIVEQGRHADLLARNGVYAELVRRQVGVTA